MESRKVLVVERDLLFQVVGGYFQGFKETDNYNLVHQLEKKAIWMNKQEAEINSDFKQIIGYTAIFHDLTKSVFAYQRSTNDDDYKEKRLQGKWSWGVGGHVEKCDSAFPVAFSVRREIQEEIDIGSSPISSPELLGFINDDFNNVGKVHFGILFLCEVESLNVAPKDSEIAFGELKRISEIVEISRNKNTEPWSVISVPLLVKRLGG